MFSKAQSTDSRLCSQACKTAMLSDVFLMLSEQTNVILSTTGGVKLTLAHGPHSARRVLPRSWPAVSNTWPVAQNWSPVKRATTVELVQFLSNRPWLIFYSPFPQAAHAVLIPDSGFYLFRWPASAAALKPWNHLPLHITSSSSLTIFTWKQPLIIIFLSFRLVSGSRIVVFTLIKWLTASCPLGSWDTLRSPRDPELDKLKKNR